MAAAGAVRASLLPILFRSRFRVVTVRILATADPALTGCRTALQRLSVIRILSFNFDRQCKLDQTANCFRARGLVFLLLGPVFNSGPKRGRKP